MLRHLLPNITAPVLVAGMFLVGDFIILEAVMAYFGLGIVDRMNPPVVSWGNMLAEAQQLYRSNWTNVFFPGFLIFRPRRSA